MSVPAAPYLGTHETVGRQFISADELSSGATEQSGVGRRHFWTWWATITVGATAGTALIGESYRQSIVSGHPSYPEFWAGVLAFMLPAVAFVARARSRRGGLLVIIVASGLFLYIPKILRDPFGPTYHDELAHWRQVQDIVSSGHLFVPNTTIPIIQSYPGLHIVTMTVQELTGMSTWSSAMVLLAIFHVIDLLAVFLILEGFSRSPRVGAIGALLYSLNSSYMYFDTQFAYESLGVTLFLLTLLAVQRVERAPDRSARFGWGAVASLVGASCAVTHHLSTTCLCLVLVGWSIVAVHRARRSRQPAHSAFAVVTVTVVVVGFFIGWIVLAAPGTVVYLEPYIKQSLSQLTKTLGGGHDSRTLFSQGAVSTAVAPPPKYEELGAFLSPLLMLIVAGLTLQHIRRHRRGIAASLRQKYAGFTILFAFGLLYFPSIPFLLAPSGAEGARRTWAFTYLGVAVIVAPTIHRWLNRSRVVRPSTGFTMRMGLLGLFIVVLIGNVAAGLDESLRFPGPYSIGSDTGAQTPELAALSKWFPDTVGIDNKVVSDQFTGLQLGAIGQQLLDAPSAGFPTYQFWLNRGDPSSGLIGELVTSNYRYLVIDTQMTLPVSELKGFFTYSGAASTDGTTKVTAADLNRFAGYDWLTRVYDSTNFAVYRFQWSSRGLSGNHP